MGVAKVSCIPRIRRFVSGSRAAALDVEVRDRCACVHIYDCYGRTRASFNMSPNEVQQVIEHLRHPAWMPRALTNRSGLHFRIDSIYTAHGLRYVSVYYHRDWCNRSLTPAGVRMLLATLRQALRRIKSTKG